MFVSNFDSADATLETLDVGLSTTELLSTNWQTTAALGLTIATGGVTGALMLTAFPAQTLAASGAIAGLAYAGKRRVDGLDAIPFIGKKSDDQTEANTQDKAEATEPSAA